MRCERAGGPGRGAVAIRGRRILGWLLVACAIVFGADVATASAGTGLSVVPNIPSPLTVGQRVAATLTISNQSTGPPVPTVTLMSITLVPSCGAPSGGADCDPASVDPGVLVPSATGTGAAGTACAGTAFTITLVDASEGKYAFVPSPAVVLAPAAACTIDFTVGVAAVPTNDANTDLFGAQTDAIGFAAGDGSDGTSGTATGTAEITIGPATVTTLPTQVSSSNISLGDSFNDTARLSPPPGAVAPTGTVTFDVYGPGDPTCSGALAFPASTVPAGASAVSGDFTPVDTSAGVGTYNVVASYSGDPNYAPAASMCGDANESVDVGYAPPTVTTAAAPATITLGASFDDTATVGGLPSGAPTPTGQVTFDVYGPNDPNCQQSPVSSSSDLDDTGMATMGAFTPPAAGSYQVVATYGGDGNFPSSASACGDPAETVVVGQAPLTLATQVDQATITLGGSFHDTATLGGSVLDGGPAPSGSVTFSVYGPADATCSQEPLFTSTNGLAGVQATSDAFTPADVGTYRVIATYAGEPNYTAPDSACGDPAEAVVVGSAPETISTQVAPAAITLGGSFQDTATLPTPTGASTPTGAVTFSVYAPSDPACAGPPVLTSSQAVVADDAGDGTATSDPFVPAGAGTYRVIAAYGGDANYGPATSACTDAGESVTVSRAQLPLTTQVAPAAILSGASFTDTATLGSPPTGAAAATGSVTFDVYGPANSACTGTAAFSSTNALGSGGTATSDAFVPTAPGTYRVLAAYGGDVDYAPSTSSCADATEVVVVTSSLPAVSAISPTSGPQAGGNTVTITGTAFSGASAVHFGPAAATGVVVVSSTQITATAPPGTGTVDVTVTTAGGTSTTGGADQYTYVAPAPPGPPVVTALTPTSGTTAGGTVVVVFGSNLSGATAVSFGGAAAQVSSVNLAGTQLTTIAPAGSGTVDVTVVTPLGTSPTGTADRFTYVPPAPAPVVSGVSPGSGPVGGGTAVTITGTNLTGISAIDFGGMPVASFTVTGSTQVTATAPAGSGTVDVTVTTAGGTSAASAADRFSYTSPPAGAVPAPPTIPTSTTGAPKVLSSSSVRFTATINPQGLPTTMHFEYTTARGAAASGAAASTAAIVYDARTPEQPVGADFGDHVVTATVTGLIPNSGYHVRVVAANAAGTTAGPDATFTTATDPAPPPPVLGTSFNAEPISGVVYVLLPGKGHVSQAHASAAKGVGFIPLTEARQLPVGTIFDTSSGVARLTTATATIGKVQSGNFGAGLFKLLQNRRQHGLTELSLVNSSNAAKTCVEAGKAQSAARRALPKTILTLLRATAKGRFQTHGRYSSATVRGTTWTTSNRCDGTLTKVKRGVVVVNDFRHKRQIVLRAGRAYLSRAP